MPNHQYGPFKNDNPEENVPAYPSPSEAPVPEFEKNREELVEYFTRRRARLQIVATTSTPRGQQLDWVPIESQYPDGVVPSPPGPTDYEEASDSGDGPDGRERAESPAFAELEADGVERGPSGTVPILRKKLDSLGYTLPLRQYLAKYSGARVLDDQGVTRLVPGPGARGSHRYGYSGRRGVCFGGEGTFSVFDPFTASSTEFSLIQIGLSNSDLGFKQTVEAGWQAYQDIAGDWVPHLFVYYTTNGYSKDDDYQGGYNTDVEGWKQHDDRIFPGTTFTPYSSIGGPQRAISIKYQLFRDNWWLNCQGRWVGHYPARLFMGNQSVFSTLGDHADHIAFYAEVGAPGATASATDMGSGRFAQEGFGRSAYMHNLRLQSGRNGEMVVYDGSNELFASDVSLYTVDAHFNSGSSWGSYLFVGGPGAG
jgi:hypothetical protein